MFSGQSSYVTIKKSFVCAYIEAYPYAKDKLVMPYSKGQKRLLSKDNIIHSPLCGMAAELVKQETKYIFFYSDTTHLQKVKCNNFG